MNLGNPTLRTWNVFQEERFEIPSVAVTCNTFSHVQRERRDRLLGHKNFTAIGIDGPIERNRGEFQSGIAVVKQDRPKPFSALL